MSRAPRSKTLVITEADNTKLDELCSLNNAASKQWLGQVFLRYGMRHARRAIQDDAKRASLVFPEDEEDA